MTEPYDDCTLCEDFPRAVFTPGSTPADLERHFSDLLEQARVTRQIIVLVPGALRGYELFTLDSGPRADMVRLAIGKP